MDRRAWWIAIVCAVAAACGGEVTSPDSGPDPVDGGPRDGGPPPPDTGPPPPPDAGTDATPPPPDAGRDSGVVTGMCMPAPVVIQETCPPPFMRCGGDVIGAWCYTGACIEESELVGGGCSPDQVEFRDVMGTVTGRVVFTDMRVTRMATTHVEGTLVLAAGCSFGMCMLAQTLINRQLTGIGMATCAANADGGCDCRVVIDTAIDSDDPYTNDGMGTLTIGDPGSARTFDYCVGADRSMRFRETGAMAQEPGIQTISPEP